MRRFTSSINLSKYLATAQYTCLCSPSESILEHVYRSRPATARVLLPLYLAHSVPRPSLIYLPNINPPTLLFSITHNNLLLLSPVSTETEPLFALEFLHRVTDVLEEFLGEPLLATSIQGAYDVVAQLLSEMCDAGSVCNTEPNALRDDVDSSGFFGKLLGGMTLPGYTRNVAQDGNNHSLRHFLGHHRPYFPLVVSSSS